MPASKIFLSALVAMNAFAWLGAEEPQARPEYRVKARIIRLLMDYVEWPKADSGRPLVIGVLDPSPFGNDLQQEMEKAVIQGRPVRVERHRTASRISACDVVFIPEDAEAGLESILAKLKGRPILSIGSTPGFAGRGVIVNLAPLKERTRLEVNLGAMQRSGLAISPQVLKGATIVD